MIKDFKNILPEIAVKVYFEKIWKIINFFMNTSSRRLSDHKYFSEWFGSSMGVFESEQSFSNGALKLMQSSAYYC